MKTIYRRIRDLREDKDISQGEIAEQMGMKQRQYSHYELGSRMITPEALIAIAKFHETSVDYLLELTNELTPYTRK